VSRDSGLGDRGFGVRIPVGSRTSRPAPGPTHAPTQRVPEAISPGVTRQEREADHSPIVSAEVKKC
jgi:hypothetical protein